MRLYLLLFSFTLLTSCSVLIPNTQVCAVAGTMAAGSDCAYTLSDDTSSMDLDAWIQFLEPQEATATAPARGAAICQSAEDWNKLKTATEQLCKKAGRWCSYEAQQKIEAVTTRVELLQSRVMGKRHAQH